MAAVWMDPGHGFPDVGALTGDHDAEADSNLAMGLILKPLLLAAGHSVMLSREADVGLSLYERVDMAWRWGADLFISLHADAASRPGPCGPHAIHSIHDTKWDRGKRLAFLLTQALPEVTGRAAWRQPWCRRSLVTPWLDYYGILRYAHAKRIHAAVILERGFVTNPEDARLLFDDEYLKLQAKGIVLAVKRYGL